MRHPLIQWYRGAMQSRPVRLVAWTALLFVAVVVVNIAGISLLGGIDGWTAFLRRHRWHFFAWRVVLYIATLFGWLWMRKRVRSREHSPDAEHRLRRAEFAAVAAVLAIEGLAVLHAI